MALATKKPIADGERFPDFKYTTRVAGAWTELKLANLHGDSKFVIFGLPGAFTPTCSNHQLPDYDALAPEFAAVGVDKIFCVSVNDPFVMNAWFDDQDVKNVIPVPDGNADLTQALGMYVQKRNLNFGARSWRYALVVDGATKTVIKAFVEPGFEDNHEEDPYVVSDPQSVLEWCKANV